MEHDFFDMYLEEMRSITPLERDEMVSVLEGTARGDAGARSRLVEGCLGEVLEMVREYGDSELPLSDLVQEANTALMLAAIEYDGSEPWNELMTRRVKESVELALDALTVNGEGQAAAPGQDEEERPNPVRNGWNLEEGL